MPGVEDFAPHVHPDAVYYSRTAAVCVENTTNMAGGKVWPLGRLREVSGWARGAGLGVHLDGARFFNAVAGGGGTAAEIAACCDTVSICFSKGLGCPMGSVLVGREDMIRQARRDRKILGGACRQAGVIAGACRYALRHNVDRLAEDHSNARGFAEVVLNVPGVTGEVPESNLVFFHLADRHPTPRELCGQLRDRGVLMEPAGPGRVRACTHLDVSAGQVRAAAEAVAGVLAG